MVVAVFFSLPQHPRMSLCVSVRWASRASSALQVRSLQCTHAADRTKSIFDWSLRITTARNAGKTEEFFS